MTESSIYGPSHMRTDSTIQLNGSLKMRRHSPAEAKNIVTLNLLTPYAPLCFSCQDLCYILTYFCEAHATTLGTTPTRVFIMGSFITILWYKIAVSKNTTYAPVLIQNKRLTKQKRLIQMHQPFKYCVYIFSILLQLPPLS